MRIDPRQEAERLLAGLAPDTIEDLRAEPDPALELYFEIELRVRSATAGGTGCAVDGTYRSHPTPRITYAEDAGPQRARFTLLHEFGHHLIEHDDHLNDLEVDPDERRDEQICNEVAAIILIPEELVEELLPRGKFTAADVAELHAKVDASRMACCVAAARRLGRPGAVILGTPAGEAVFTAHHPSTNWWIARQTMQPPKSLLHRASSHPGAAARGVTKVRFATGTESSDMFGDAHHAADGWIYEVIVDDTHSPWETGLNLGIESSPVDTDMDCPHCGAAETVWTSPCRRCGDQRCPQCGRCSCPLGPRPKTCPACHTEKAPGLFDNGSERCRDCAAGE